MRNPEFGLTVKAVQVDESTQLSRIMEEPRGKAEGTADSSADTLVVPVVQRRSAARLRIKGKGLRCNSFQGYSMTIILGVSELLARSQPTYAWRTILYFRVFIRMVPRQLSR